MLLQFGLWAWVAVIFWTRHITWFEPKKLNFSGVVRLWAETHPGQVWASV